MKWYWAVIIYLAGLLFAIALLIACHKLIEDEEMKRHYKEIKKQIKDEEDEKI